MAAEPVDIRPETAVAVAEYLASHLPRLDDGTGWDHRFSTAYQIGCEALSALGFAEETTWGAIPKAVPTLPDRLPRWDDLSVAVLWLAEQQNRLSYLRHDGRIEPRHVGKWTVVQANPPPPPVPNIAGAFGLGPALAADETLVVLGHLGLVRNAAWTAAAETVQWRCQPREWEMRIESDPRFLTGVARALETMPGDVGAEVERLATVTEADLQAYAAQNAERYVATANRAAAGRPPPDPMEVAKRMVPWDRQNKLDWLFFRRWRLEDGWLSDADSSRVYIFHDPLAIGMRRTVLRRLHPDSPVAQA